MLPKHTRILEDLGERIRLARLRRKLSAQQVSERAGISRVTLSKIEKGAPGTSIGNVLQVFVILSLEEDFHLLAKDDILGRKLQDANLTQPRQRAPKRTPKP